MGKRGGHKVSGEGCPEELGEMLEGGEEGKRGEEDGIMGDPPPPPPLC